MGDLSVLGLKGPFSKFEFRRVCMAADQLYLMGMAITTDSIIAYCSEMTPGRVKTIMEHEDFQEFLNRQNIKTGKSGGLTAEQTLTIRAVTDMGDKRSLRAKLASVGVTHAKYQTWLKDGYFVRALKQMADDLMEEAWPLAKAAVAQQAVDGSLQHIKFLGELNGRHDPLKRQAMDVEAIIRDIVELVGKYLTPEQQIQFGGELSLKLAVPKTKELE